MSSSPNCSVYHLDTDIHTLYFNSTKYVPFLLLFPMDSSPNAGRTVSLLTNTLLMDKTFYGEEDTMEDDDICCCCCCYCCFVWRLR